MAKFEAPGIKGEILWQFEFFKKLRRFVLKTLLESSISKNLVLWSQL